MLFKVDRSTMKIVCINAYEIVYNNTKLMYSLAILMKYFLKAKIHSELFSNNINIMNITSVH